MATKLVWDRNSEADLEYYRVFLGGVFQAKVLQTPVGTKPEWQLPAVGAGNLTVTAVDKSGNESDMSVLVPFDKIAPAAPVNLVLV
jgi:hypothetical protein